MKELRKIGFTAAVIAVVGILLQLAFWLGLIFGALWLLKHFGVIH